MHNFTYYSPTKVIFGQGMVPKIVPELQKAGISKVLLLTGGKSVFASGLYDTITALLRDAGIAFETVSGVQPNPRLSKAREAVAVAEKIQAQAVIPVGGGSVFDSAKAIAASAGSHHDVWDIITRKQKITAALPIYGILTLSGTSSEINDTAVINNEETNDKMPVAHPLLYPTVSIVDPSLQYTVPLQQVRYGGFDTIVHVLEAYLAGNDTGEVITEHCEAYLRAAMRCLRALPEKLHDYEVRSELTFCATYAFSGWCGLGRSGRGDFATHRIGHALSAIFDLPHAVTLSVIMPNWMEYVLDKGLNRDVFARFGTKVLGVPENAADPARAAIDAFRDVIHSLDMPSRLRDANVPAKDIPALAENAARTLPFGSVVPMDLATVTAVLERSL
ncbi:Iron-containing alcohol dehydrogenase [uncultured delta proteobacterium]|uniref:Iron-containing alcohol dehydrogenase n=1 Tax=uncultured delta proteobacterium TaxID=34034 RepID=A0A212JJB7_9DELT|nr:Iron-containing alcohol dehydrogenase [uncultured delta proteobacterium]